MNVMTMMVTKVDVRLLGPEKWEADVTFGVPGQEEPNDPMLTLKSGEGFELPPKVGELVRVMTPKILANGEPVLDFQREVGKWAAETFPHQTSRSKMAHLLKEINELQENLNDGEEMADCFILLLNMAEMAGVDLMSEARRKMEINRQRRWGLPDEDGVCLHLK